ncbi:MAG: peptidylprolyl isomerase [Candidatus Cloacimonetes bacterium]|nr:peptidylprolyl isomerase [Candidatus Cloacimonadota bacterium]
MKKAIFISVLLIAILLPANLHARRFARWYTNMGEFTAEIRNEIMPITGDNFLELALTNFYDNLIFHRVVAGFVIQDGCPNGTGTGGPGYTIEDESSPLILHDRAGILSMAKSSQPNSAGSQYFITLGSFPHLDGTYAAFGKVIEGLDIVYEIGRVPVNASDKPIVPVVIDSIRVLGLEVQDIMPADTLLTAEAGNSIDFSIDAYDVNEFVEASYQWLVNDDLLLLDNAAFNYTFEDAGEYIVTCIVSDSHVDFTHKWYISVEPNSISDLFTQVKPLQIIASYPNPFKDEINLIYQTKSSNTVDISIYDIKGRLVNKYPNINALNGENNWQWNGKNSLNNKVANGIYLYKIDAGNTSAVGKMIRISD